MFFIYGAKHYGKGQLSHRYGICESCGKPGHLKSYTTAQFLHLWWIPLIPIGHNRVMDLCPHCNTCRNVSPRLQNRAKKEATERILSNIKDKPNDPSTIKECFGILAVYNETELFEKFAALYSDKFARQPEVLLDIAKGYFRLGEFEKCAETARKAKLSGADDVDDLIDAALTYAQNKASDMRHPPSKIGIPILTPYLVPLLIIFGILGNFGFKGFNAGRAREVWLVNGSFTPYTVELNDKTHTLAPLSHKQIKIPMGEHAVEITDTVFPIENFTFNYQVPFTKRLSDTKTLVLNPDGLAFLVNQSLPYVEDGSLINYDVRYDYFFGKQWYEISGIDYAFKEPPDSINLYSAVEYKDHLFLLEADSYLDVLNVMPEDTDFAVIQDYSRRAVCFDPETDNGNVLLRLARGTNTLENLTYLQQGLDQRPILLEWHRFYQTVMESEQPDYNLIPEYQSLVELEPNEPKLKYLLGRVTEDQAAAEALYLASEEGPGCGGYGYYAIAYGKICKCSFSDALTYAEKSMQQNPTHSDFAHVYTESRLANGRFEDILKEVRSNKELRPYDGDIVALEIRYLHQLGKSEDAKRIGALYLAENPGDLEPETLGEWKSYFAAMQYYAENEDAHYLKALTKATPEKGKFETAMHSGNLEPALKFLKEQGHSDFNSYLTLYIAALYHGDQATAATALNKVTELTPNDQELAAMLDGSMPISPEELRTYPMFPDEKKLMACALGLQHKEQRAAYFELARKCNYSPFYPQHLINKWTTLN